MAPEYSIFTAKKLQAFIITTQVLGMLSLLNIDHIGIATNATSLVFLNNVLCTGECIISLSFM